MSDLFALSREIYDETLSKFGRPDLGFKILYGPPVSNPPIFFIGFQPGGGSKRKDADEQELQMQVWPEQFDYAVQEWPLAKRIREIWDRNFLLRCSGANLIFARAASKADWQKVNAQERNEWERFGRKSLSSLISQMEPKHIIVIGTQTLSELSNSKVVQAGVKGRTLVRQGRAFNCEAHSVIHLSGAQISNADRFLIKNYFEKLD